MARIRNPLDLTVSKIQGILKDELSVHEIVHELIQKRVPKQQQLDYCQIGTRNCLKSCSKM